MWEKSSEQVYRLVDMKGLMAILDWREKVNEVVENILPASSWPKNYLNMECLESKFFVEKILRGHTLKTLHLHWHNLLKAKIRKFFCSHSIVHYSKEFFRRVKNNLSSGIHRNLLIWIIASKKKRKREKSSNSRVSRSRFIILVECCKL